MERETIALLPKAEDDSEKEIMDGGHISNVRHPRLIAYRSDSGSVPRAAVVVCPGGGYGFLSFEKEGEAVAEWFNSLGMDAYVLKYRLKEFGYPAPLIDVTRAIRYLRANARSREIDPEKIGVLGFSAGGHAAAMASNLFDAEAACVGDSLDTVPARPDFSILAYPVLTFMDPHAHAGSRQNLLGDEASAEEMKRLSLEKRVSADTPPTFLMHTADDEPVPVENSLQYATALAAAGVPFSLHVYPKGGHGIGMNPGFASASTWPADLAEWLRELGLLAASE